MHIDKVGRIKCKFAGLGSILPTLPTVDTDAHLTVQVDLPRRGVCVILHRVLLAAREHAAHQTLGAGDSGGGGGLVLLLARVLNHGLDLGHTCSDTMTKV